MADEQKQRTHAAYAFKRESKKVGRWIEIGAGRLERDRNIAHVFIDRLPLGGFSGYVMLYPVGSRPPLPEPNPHRPGTELDTDEEA